MLIQLVSSERRARLPTPSVDVCRDMNAATSQEVFAGPYLTAAGPEVRLPSQIHLWCSRTQARDAVQGAEAVCLQTAGPTFNMTPAGATEVQRRVHRHDGGVPGVPAVPAGHRRVARPPGAPVHPVGVACRRRAEQGRHEGARTGRALRCCSALQQYTAIQCFLPVR